MLNNFKYRVLTLSEI